MAREEIGLQPRSKVTTRQAQQQFDTISSDVSFLSIFRVPGKTSVIWEIFVVLKDEQTV